MSLEEKISSKKEHSKTKQALNALGFGLLGAGVGYTTAHLTIENIDLMREFLSYDIRNLLKDNQEIIEIASIPMSFFGWSSLANKRYRKTHDVPEKSGKRKIAEYATCSIAGAAAGAFLVPEIVDFIPQLKSMRIPEVYQLAAGGLLGWSIGSQVYDSYLK